MNWRETILGNEIDFFNGKSIKPGQIGRYPAYGSNGIIGGSDEWKYENAIIIGRVGAYCGSVAYCPRKFWASDNTIVSKPKNHFSSVIFYYYLLHHLELNKYAGGAAQPLVTQTVLKQVSVRIPDVETQHRIASILSAYDDLIENNTRRIAILEEMARRIYEEWFVHFRFPGHEKVKMVDSELGKIPEGWKIRTLGEYAFITMGQSPKSEFYNQDGNGLPFHQGVTDFGRHFPIHRMYCTAQARIAEFGDILMSVRAPVGRINLAPSKMVIGRGLCAMRSKSGQQRFLLHLLLEKFREEDSMGNGAIFKAVTKEEVYGICFPLPSLNFLNQFETIVEPFWGRIENLTKKNANLRSTRDFLLPKLISGEIDVSKLPEPEEAAA